MGKKSSKKDGKVLSVQVKDQILALPPGEYTLCGMTDEVHRRSGGHLRMTPQFVEMILTDLEAAGRVERSQKNWKLT